MSTPVRIIKLPCNESGPWTNTGIKTMNFDIPADLGVIDLDRSYLLFKMTATTTETDASHNDALRPVGIAGGQPSIPAYDSDCLIRNSYFHSERAGRLEDLNDANVLNQALNFYSRSGEDIQADTVYNGAFQYDEAQRPHSAFRKLKYLNDAGELVANNQATDGEVSPEIRIPLPKVCKMADGLRQFPVFATGDCRLHAEIVDDTVTVMSTVTYTGENWLAEAMDTSGGLTGRKEVKLLDWYQDPQGLNLWAGAPVNVAYNEVTTSGGINPGASSADLWWHPTSQADVNFDIATQVVTLSGADFTAVVGNQTGIEALTLNLNFTNPAMSSTNPYDQTKLTVDVCAGGLGLFPGDEFTATAAGVNWTFKILDNTAVPVVKSHNDIITSIDHSASSGLCTITLENGLTQVANGHAGGVTLSVPAAASNTWQIDEANLVVHQLLLSPDQMTQMEKNVNAGIDIPYMVWDTERANVNASETLYANQFRLPPRCGNVLIVKPDNDNILNQTDTVTSYRYEINGTQTTDRDVDVREPLYFDRILECWANMNKEVKNLDERFSLDTTETLYSEAPMMSCQPVPLMNEPGILDYRCEATGMTSGLLRCYKQKQRVLKLSGQRAEVEN